MDQVSRLRFRNSRRQITGALRCAAFAGWLALFLVRPPAWAAEEVPEYHVKAAFLLNFTKFTEWSATAFDGPDKPIAICILGDDPFGAILDRIVTGETVNGRKVVARRVRQLPAPKSCQLLFLDKVSRQALATLAEVGPGVLTVGEGDGFLKDGGMIAFVVENRRVRFDINQKAAAAAGVKLSSRLLSVARSVE